MHYIVIDLEATCDEPVNPDPQEIIEFPALLVDSTSRSITAEFHAYVRPVAHPTLTPFCRQLTGIPQEQVHQAPHFPSVLQQFQEWLDAHCLEDFLPVTCGDWDLGSLLPRQCQQHNLPVPKWAERWANAKRVFAWNHPQAARATGLRPMVDALGLTWIGRPHSGIDDSRNIAQVLAKMLAAGVRFENTAFWHCLNCGQQNPYRARQCVRCRRPLFAPGPGDWICPVCGFGNYKVRNNCFDCGYGPKETRAAPCSASSGWKRGDWQCAACGVHNFARRTACFQCGADQASKP